MEKRWLQQEMLHNQCMFIILPQTVAPAAFFLESQHLPQDLQDFKGQSDEKERNFVLHIIIHRGYLNQNTS